MAVGDPNSRLSMSHRTINFIDSCIYLSNNPRKKTVLNKAKAEAIYNKGRFYALINDFDKALEIYGECLKIQISVFDKVGQAYTNNEFGFIYSKKGDYKKSIGYFEKALAISENINDKKLIALSYSNLAFQYINYDLNTSQEYYRKSLNIRKEIGDQRGIGSVYNQMGTNFKKLGKLDSAHIYFQKCLDVRIKTKDQYGLGYIYSSIANLNKESNNLDTAIYYATKALDIRKQIKDSEGIVFSLVSISQVHLLKSDYEKSMEYGEDALKIAKDIGLPATIREASNNLKEIYKKLGKYEKVYEMYDLYYKMKDSISNSSNRNEAIKSYVKYEYEKKEAVAKAEYERKQAISMLEIEKRQSMLEKSQQERIVLEKDNELKELNLSKNAAELKQKEILAENQTRKLELLRKEQEINKIESEKKESDLNRQKIFNSALIGGVILISIILLIAIRGYIRKRKDNQTIQQQKTEVEEQREVLSQKNHLIEEKQKEILDSINYAKRIQYTLLAHDQYLKENLKDHFVLFNPKDIVSGDFYWATKQDDRFYLAACDSTGHGIPGAFMSLLNIGFLSEAINEKGISKPNEVLNYVRQKLTNTVSRDGQKDGFDGILVCFEKNKITYAAANNAPVLIKNDTFLELQADRMPVGVGERKQDFSLHSISMEQGDSLFLYTDGFADQFGGPRGKKFKYKQLNELLVVISSQSVTEQKEKLQTAFNSWRGDLEQVDDVCVIGIKI